MIKETEHEQSEYNVNYNQNMLLFLNYQYWAVMR